MVPQGPVEIILSLIETLILDSFNARSFDRKQKNLSMDLLTLRQRSSNEGFQFMTKTLPILGRALDSGLEEGSFSCPRAFAKSHVNKCIPAFLQEYFNDVFDVDGRLRVDPDVDSIRFLRQVLYFAYKCEFDVDKASEQLVVQKFVEIDSHIGSEPIDPILTRSVSYLAEKVLSGFDPFDIIPKHGPGSVATGEKLDKKYLFKRKYSHLHQLYPYWRYFVSGINHLLDSLEWYRNLEPVELAVAKLIVVPKDSRGGRTISSEPLELMWIQQGLGRKLMQFIESNHYINGRINFADQSINGKLALQSSTDRKYSTIDLKDASDRVSLELVKQVFGLKPKFLSALLATRSHATRLPDGTIIELKKFAPMGSALCFPVESLVFWLVSVAAVARQHGLAVERVKDDIFVYGDDIVCLTEYYDAVVAGLSSVGLMVNKDKSYSKGFFRESCGVDAFKGTDVTPTRLRQIPRQRTSDSVLLASWCALGNALSQKGYPLTSDWIFSYLEKRFGKIPFGLSRSGYPCRVVSDPEVAEFLNRIQRTRSRFNKETQKLEFRCLVVKTTTIDTQLDGWSRALRDLTTPPYSPDQISVRRSVTLKPTWVSV